MEIRLQGYSEEEKYQFWEMFSPEKKNPYFPGKLFASYSLRHFFFFNFKLFEMPCKKEFLDKFRL